MKTPSRILASLALTAILAAVSLAQDAGGGPPQSGPGMGGPGMAHRQGGPGMGGPMAPDRLPPLAQLAGRPEVAKELGLSDDQLGQLRTVAMSMRESMRPQPGGENDGPPDFQAMRAAHDKAEADADAKVKTILTAAQAKRIAEIQVQSMGLTAALVPSVQTRLKLTDDQKAQLKALVPARGPGGPGGMGGPPPGGPGGDQGGPPDMQGGQGGPPDMQGGGPGGPGGPGGMGGPGGPRGGMDARRKALETKIAAILTSDQKASLKAMGGKPIKLAPARGMGGPGGPGGGPGGPGGPGGERGDDPR